MERWFMGKIKTSAGMVLVLLANMLFGIACAQNLHRQNMDVLEQVHQIEQTTSLFNNQNQLLPLKKLDGTNIACLHTGSAPFTAFDSLLNKYTRVSTLTVTDYKTLADAGNALKLYNTLIVPLTDADAANAPLLSFINGLSNFKQVIWVFFGKAAGLSTLNPATSPLIWCSQTSNLAQGFAAQAVFGGVAIVHKPSQTYSDVFKAATASTTTKIRLQYTVPEAAGINADKLTAIDDIAREAIANHATPGCVVLVARDGKVIFNKAYGYHTYDKTYPDKISDIFDLASVTKVSATTMEVMRLTEDARLNIDSTVGYYLPQARGTNKSDIKVRELLLHQAGLTPYIPFYERLKPVDFSRDSSDAYPTKVCDNYYLCKGYFTEVMWPEMLNSALRTRGKYVYSDLSMYFMREVVETITAQPLNQFVQQQFYTPLGMQTAGFLPRNRFKREQIIPTENDTYFRMNLVHGYVHDQGAAMAGGVSGHAGLFASANDLAILFQMLLNGGTYGSIQYFKPQTVAMFTARQSAVSRRGFGFDRWDPDTTLHYPSHLASPQTYGHTGYTGTCVWVDPQSQLVYIFLSNRVYPKVTDKLSQTRVRGRIQDVVYKAIAQGL